MEGTLGGLEESVETLIQGQVELNEAAGRWTNESGDFISSTEAQERALKDLNSVGVESTQQVREQIERLESLRAIYADDAKAASELSEKQQRLRTELAEAGQAFAQQNRDLSRLDQEFSEATVAMADFSKRQERLQQELRETAAAQDRVSSSGVTLRSSVQASASNLSFELVQASQDATHSLGAVANQIPLISEQFSQLTSKTGSTTGALFALRSSLLGPAGIIGAITLGLPLVQQLTSSLFEAGEGAETFEDSVSSAADSVLRLREASEDPIRLGLEKARRQADLLLTRIEELRGLRSDVQEFDPGQTLRPTAGGALQPSGIALPQEGAAATTPAQAEDLERLREQVDLSEQARQRLNDIIAERELQNELLERERQQIASSSELMRGQVRQIQKGTASTEALVTASEEGVVRFQRLSGLADDLLGRYQSVNQLLEGQNRLVDENLVTQEQVTDELASRLEDAENIEQVQQRLNTAVEDGLITREQMQAVMEDIRSDTEDTSEEAEELAEAQRRITSAIEEEVIAREEAKALVEDLGTSNDQIARSTAEALGNVEDLKGQLSDLASPQGKALAQARRTKEQFQRQAEALRNVNRILARRGDGIQAQQVQPIPATLVGSAPDVLQSIQDLSGEPNVLKQYAQQLREARIQAQELNQELQDIELAGSSEERGAEGLAEDLDEAATSSSRIRTSLRSLAREKPLTALTSSVEELKSEFKLSKQQAEQLKDTVKSDLASAAGNVGADLVEAFKDGKAEAQELVGVFQSGVANVLERFGGPLGAFAAPIVRSFQHGGEVRGPGGPTDDQVPAMLSDQEFVMRAASAQVAPEALQAMNQDPALAGMVEQMFVGREPEEFASGTSASSLPAPAHYASARIRAQSANQQEQALNRIAERLDEMKVRGTLTGDMDEIRAGIERNAEFKGR
jgi:DNA repair exonuclease SbcCD ATPase subunit